MPEHLSLGLVLAAIVASGWAMFLIARTIIRVVLFLTAFCLGFGLIWGVGLATGHAQPLWAVGAESLAFAWAWSLIRARLFRLAATAMLVGVSQLAAHFGFAPGRLLDMQKHAASVQAKPITKHHAPASAHHPHE